MRIWQDNNLFEEVEPDSWWEADLEAAFLRHSKNLFPDFITVPFKAEVVSGFRRNRPDLAMVSTDASGWIVVEIEKAEHSLERHVIPQIETFAYGVYDERHGDCLDRVLADAGEGEAFRREVRNLMGVVPPKILVVADKIEISWRHALRQMNALLIACRFFRSVSGETLIAVDGDTLALENATVLARCQSPSSMPRWWKLDEYGFLQDRESLEIVFQGRKVEWRVLRTKIGVWITPNERLRLNGASETVFYLVDRAGNLELRRGT